jgi:hypothetical protein
VGLDDPLREGEAHAGALPPRVEAMEQVEDPLVMAALDADAVVPHEEDALPIGRAVAPPDGDPRIGLVSHELGGVVQEILEELDQALAVARHYLPGRRLGHLDSDTPLLEPALHQGEGLAHDLAEGQVLVGPGNAARP